MPAPGARAATIADVAASAGVSPGTASKALNGRGNLRDETVRRVRAAADRLDYQPNPAARSLKTRSTYTVGMLTTDSIGRFSIPLLSGVEHTLGAGEMSVFLCDARDDPIREQYYLQTLLRRRVDGIIVTGRRTDSRPPVGTHLPIPVVYAFIRSADPADCSVVPDERQGVQLAVQHLLDTGRRRLAHITGPRHHYAAVGRAQATQAAVAQAGATLVREPHFGEWSEAWGRQAASVLTRSHPDVDAVFCGNDQIARGVTETLQHGGRRVPDDVAVVGFDNWDAMALGCQPPLTTVDMDLEGLGRAAARKLLDAINGAPSPGVHQHPCHLVVRETTVRPHLPRADRAERARP